MMEGKLNKKKNVFSPARSIILRLIQKSRRSMSTLMKWRAPREISEENLQRINLQLCSSRDVAYKSHVSEKYVDRNGPYTRCYLSAMSWKIFVFLFFFFLRSTLRYAKVIIRVKWRKITFDKSAIRSFKQIWFSTRWNFRGEPKISMEKSEGNRESFATWIHPWNSHKSHLEFLFARNFSWLSQLFQSSGMIVSRERERDWPRTMVTYESFMIPLKKQICRANKNLFPNKHVYSMGNSTKFSIGSTWRTAQVEID